VHFTEDNRIGDRQVHRRHLGVLRKTYGRIFTKQAPVKWGIPAEHRAGAAENLGPSPYPYSPTCGEGEFCDLRRERPSKKPRHPQTIRGRSGTFRRVAAPEAARRADFAATSDPVAEIYAGYVVAGTAFKVVLRADFGLDATGPGAAEQRVAPGPPGSREVQPFRTFCRLLT
jgi:hypothetical protein